MLEDIGKIKKEILEYLDVKLDLLRLHTAENISRILSNAATIVIVCYLIFLILLFLSFAAGFFIASHLHSNELGFICVAGFYFLLLIVFLLLRKQIVDRPIIQAIVKLLFPKKSENEKK